LGSDSLLNAFYYSPFCQQSKRTKRRNKDKEIDIATEEIYIEKIVKSTKKSSEARIKTYNKKKNRCAI